MKYRNIIWDYNGTIINDAQLAVDAENVVLKSYGLPEIDLAFYLTILFAFLTWNKTFFY